MQQRHDRGNEVRDRMHDHYHDHGHWNHWHDHMWDHHPGWAWWNVTRPLRWAQWANVGGWCYGGSYWGDSYYYYDYGGDIYYEEGNVYVDEEQVATEAEYAQQATDLAAAGATAIDEAVQQNTAEQIEWLTLGVYALVSSEQTDPTMFLQLAVSKEGVIGGSYFNAATNQTLPVQGSVDPETQRAAWTLGDNHLTVLETGIYNLTEDETPVLIHFGQDNTQTWTLVRTEDPETADAAAATGN